MRALARKGKSAAARLYRGYNRHRVSNAPAPSTKQVRILLLHANGMGGTIRTVFNLAGYLARDHDVEIVSVLKEAEQPFFPIDPRVKFRFLDDRLRPAPNPLRALLSKRPSRLIPKEESAYHRFNLWTDLKLARYIRSLENGVLIGTRPGLNLAMAQLALPSVITIGQEHVALRTQAEPVQALIKWRYRRLDALATLTKADLADYRNTLPKKPRKLIRIPNAVPPMTGGVSKLDAKVAVAVGRMTRIKGFHRLITAWQTVAETHPDWKLRIFGAGPQEETLAQLIVELGLEGKVELPGPTSDVGAELERASIYVLSSRHEGFPMTILEAMAKGLAIVSFNSPHGPKEMISHEVDGLLVKPRTNANLAASIIRVIEDEHLRRGLAARAIETARTYDVDAIGQQWDALLAELLARRTGTYTRPERRPAETPESSTATNPESTDPAATGEAADPEAADPEAPRQEAPRQEVRHRSL
ncbi:glycosyltransferase family 4 protein [Nonomuraea jiangxiensis]|uniref:Glycosyltransferase involved in cell wall bisynthesis n=1 Tax=Nonomuraea jiangxiensis TaxID=633440 RepID=A0A1G9DHR9_9ACTN|nr:glycosyltransferase family 4 protein [Nonomuraea jiangxiensis]SDK63406.1 Glycosyltransferase involved in cell wall bisynthesis [Nonomuraea jiangxiensis]